MEPRQHWRKRDPATPIESASMTTSAFPGMPERPALEGIEEKWSARWRDEGLYRFDRTRDRADIYSIDTPPPTVSGSLHVGHVFSYTHTDCVARFKRMCGKEVFYPMGWDDNGLPTERRVQNFFGVRCDPSLPFDPDFAPPAEPDPKRPLPVSRRNFVHLCEQLTAEDEKGFEYLWRELGLSVDWEQTYQTIDHNARATSQLAFLRNLERGEAYQAEAPTMWDVTFQTAVAQAEMEDRERPGAYYKISFHAADGELIFVETTRPELLAACVALVAHPDDERYAKLLGTTVTTPVFAVEVPVVAHPVADPEKGSGIAMICTFGDTTDVTWWRELQLDTRPIIGWNGRLVAQTPGWLAGAGAQAYATIAGSTAFTAKERMVGLLAESGDLHGEPRPITHAVKFFEKGDKPLEIVTTRQWYLRNGGRDRELRQALLERGAQLNWHPDHMRVRYDNWVSGLNGDWLISRQRFFGVPFPLWYRAGQDGQPVYSDPILPDHDSLPVDPCSDCPPGFDESGRGAPGGFVAEPDVMDTWATSSLTPQIAGGWATDPDLWQRVAPMDLRPQAHEIIRTWLFSTLVRSHLEDDRLPWSHVAISGWILDPDRKKMSKSKGNVITPIDLLQRHGSDAVRYWAASGRPGTDTAFDEGQMKIGRRLAIKILNASRFALLNLSRDTLTSAPTRPLDLAMLAGLADAVDDATNAFSDYDYARALERTEKFFWDFCNDYLELIKHRSSSELAVSADESEGAASAQAALRIALSTLLRLFAPVLPFVTEEVWSWWQDGSVHRQPWPCAQEVPRDAGDVELLTDVALALSQIRKVKSEAKTGMRTEVRTATVVAPAASLARIRAAAQDLCAAGRIADLRFEEGGDKVSVRDIELDTVSETRP